MKKPVTTADVVVKSSINKPIVLVIVFFLLISAVSVSVYFYNQYQQTKKLLPTSANLTKDGTKDLVGAVGKLMVLPANETPTIATVSDKTKLQNQSFFADSENGDKVLIYTNAKKAILYRQSINKIIEVAPINIAVPPSPSIASATANMVTPAITTTVIPTPIMVKVAIYNGTKTPGLAATTEKQLQGKYTNIQIVSTGNTKSDYTKNLIVDLSGNNADMVQQLVGFLGGEVGPLPNGETKPNADILVILGK